MTSRRWVTVFSVAFLGPLLAAAGGARAQFDFPGLPCPPSLSEVGFPGLPPGPSFSEFSLGFETGPVFGISPYDYGGFGGASYLGPGGIGAFSFPGYGQGTGQIPQSTSFQRLSGVNSAAPGRRRRARRVRRKPRRVQVAAKTIGPAPVKDSARRPGESSSASIIELYSPLNSGKP